LLELNLLAAQLLAVHLRYTLPFDGIVTVIGVVLVLPIELQFCPSTDLNTSMVGAEVLLFFIDNVLFEPLISST
jgi:hypothetical protein